MAILGLVPSLFLAGCGGSDTVQEAFGYEQRGPDEMAVISRPPLIVPPDYNLRPPVPGDPKAGSAAASDAARKTLIGPSSDAMGAGEENGARAILTGTTPENVTRANGAGSDGQNALIGLTDRTERDLDELAGSRAENRIDRSLLRRLLAWTPEDRSTPGEGEDDEAGDTASDAPDEPIVVRVVARSQTVLEPEAGTDP